jgi:hypothetical protein
LPRQPERTRRQSGPGAKHSVEMVQAGESRSDRNIGDRIGSRLQQFLRVIDSDPKDLMKYRSLQFVAKGPFQRSPRNPAVSSYIVHRQTASGEVLLNVPKGVCNVRVIDRENLRAFSRDHSFWHDTLRDQGR